MGPFQGDHTSRGSGEPDREFTEHDVQNIASLDLENDRVLPALCRVMGLYLVTQKYSLGKDHWVVTPPGSPDVSGTREVIKAWICGYAAAWRDGRREARRLAQKMRDAIDAFEVSR